MNSKKIKNFIIPILIVVIAFAGAGFIGLKLYNNIVELNGYRQSITAKEGELSEAQKKLEEVIAKEKKDAEELAKTASRSKPFYRPPAVGMNTESVIAGEFTEILELIRVNKIKVRSIKYEYNPKNDAFVKGAGDRYEAARLNMEMIANYTDYNNFLKELYKHDHFLDIQSVEIVPYRKNKEILLINFKLKLYSQKKG